MKIMVINGPNINMLGVRRAGCLRQGYISGLGEHD